MHKDHYFHALHGLRGILSLWVFSLHLLLLMSLGFKIDAQAFWGESLTKFFWSGYLAVDAFFILSGFFISHVLANHYARENTPLMHFFGARLARLYPVHLFILGIYALLVWGMNVPFSPQCFPADPAKACDPFSVSAFVQNLFLVQAWSWFPQTSWNVNSWSISSEWALYLVAPLFMPFIFRIKNVILYTIGALLAYGALITVLSMSQDANHYHHLFIGVLEKTHNSVGAALFSTSGPAILEFGLMRATVGFISGCFLFQTFKLCENMTFAGIIPVIALIALWAIIQTSHLHLAYFSLLPMILALCFDKGIIARLLSCRAMKHMGNISYSLYMVHGLYLKCLMIILPKYLVIPLSNFEIISLLAAIIASAIFLSYLCYRFIEEPCRKLFRPKALTVNSRYAIQLATH